MYAIDYVLEAIPAPLCQNAFAFLFLCSNVLLHSCEYLAAVNQTKKKKRKKVKLEEKINLLQHYICVVLGEISVSNVFLPAEREQATDG